MKKTAWSFVMVLACAAPGWAERLPRTVIPSHYDLAFAPDFTKDNFTGEETILVDVKSEASAIVLHAAEIEFEDVHVTSGGVTQRATVTSDETRETATLKVSTALAPGPARLRIRFIGHLNDKLRGFYLSKANNRKYAVTQLEATDARRAFPCFDEPDLKATFSVQLTIDAADTAISNGKVLSDTPGPGTGKHTLRFAQTPTMSTYLVAMVVGDFVCRGGIVDAIPVRVCSTPDKKALTAFALQAVLQQVRFFNTYFGIKYPFGKLDIIGVPDFAAGAMENTAAITFRETFLLADPATASLAVRKNIAAVTSHEIAHQWFGDLVTMKWWDDVWLNEGFATWMANKPLAEWRPEWRVELDDAEESQQALRVDALQSTRPIHAAMDTPDQINEAFDAIAYQKGASVLRMIEHYVGPEVFRRGTAAYLRKYSYGNATSEDFAAEIARASGKPVTDIMAAFVGRPGAPLISVTTKCTGATTSVTLTQERFSLEPAAASAGAGWQVPICLKKPGETTRGQCSVLSAPEQTFTMPGCSPFVFINSGAKGYYRTAYPREAIERIAPRFTNAFTAAERVSLLGDEWAMARRGSHSIAAFMALADASAGERASAVMGDIQNRLTSIDEDIVAEADREVYRAWIRRTFGPALQEVGWKPTPNEPEDRKALRAQLVTLLVRTGRDPEALKRAQVLVEQWMKNPASVEPTLAAALVPLAPLAGNNAGLYERYLAASRGATRPDELARFQTSLAGFTAPDLLTRTLTFALSDEVRSQDAPTILVAALTQTDTADAAWSFVKSHWADLERTGVFQGLPRIVAATGAFCDTQHHEDVEKFFETHPVPSSERGVRQALESIQNCIAFKSAQSANLHAWLEKSQQ